MGYIAEAILKKINEKDSSDKHMIKITEKQASNLLGKSFSVIVKNMEQRILKNAKSLSDKKIKFSLDTIYFVFGGMGEPPGVAIHGQGKFSGSKGALDISVFIPVKLGKPKFRDIETVGRI
jgi:hypothetical protein